MSALGNLSDAVGSEEESDESDSDEEFDSEASNNDNLTSEELLSEEEEEPMPVRKRRVIRIESDDSDVDSDVQSVKSGEESGEGCPVCLNNFIGQDLGSPENCDHIFCLECIMEWAKNINTCPIDRNEFNYVHLKTKPNGKVLKSIRVRVSPKEPESSLQEEITVCELCRQGDREERLLLCDACDLAFHCECLDPPLFYIPIEEWFCPPCSGVLDNGAVCGSNYHRSHRVIPRTSASETVRTRIQNRRTTSSFRSPRPSATQGKKRKRRTYRKAIKKVVKLARTKQSVSGVGKGVLAGRATRVLITYRCKRRKKRRTKKSSARKTANKSASSKGGLVKRLGLVKSCKGSSVPNVQSKAELSVGSGQQPPHSLFGIRDQLMDFSEDFNEAGSSICTSPYRNNAPLSTPSCSSVNLLDSILAGQKVLHAKSEGVVIKSDGSLILKESNNKEVAKKQGFSSKIINGAISKCKPETLSDIAATGTKHKHKYSGCEKNLKTQTTQKIKSSILSTALLSDSTTYQKSKNSSYSFLSSKIHPKEIKSGNLHKREKFQTECNILSSIDFSTVKQEFLETPEQNFSVYPLVSVNGITKSLSENDSNDLDESQSLILPRKESRPSKDCLNLNLAIKTEPGVHEVTKGTKLIKCKRDMDKDGFSMKNSHNYKNHTAASASNFIPNKKIKMESVEENSNSHSNFKASQSLLESCPYASSCNIESTDIIIKKEPISSDEEFQEDGKCKSYKQVHNSNHRDPPNKLTSHYFKEEKKQDILSASHESSSTTSSVSLESHNYSLVKEHIQEYLINTILPNQPERGKFPLIQDGSHQFKSVEQAASCFIVPVLPDNYRTSAHLVGTRQCEQSFEDNLPCTLPIILPKVTAGHFNSSLVGGSPKEPINSNNLDLPETQLLDFENDLPCTQLVTTTSSMLSMVPEDLKTTQLVGSSNPKTIVYDEFGCQQLLGTTPASATTSGNFLKGCKSPAQVSEDYLHVPGIFPYPSKGRAQADSEICFENLPSTQILEPQLTNNVSKQNAELPIIKTKDNTLIDGCLSAFGIQTSSSFHDFLPPQIAQSSLIKQTMSQLSQRNHPTFDDLPYTQPLEELSVPPENLGLMQCITQLQSKLNANDTFLSRNPNTSEDLPAIQKIQSFSFTQTSPLMPISNKLSDPTFDDLPSTQLAEIFPAPLTNTFLSQHKTQMLTKQSEVQPSTSFDCINLSTFDDLPLTPPNLSENCDLENLSSIQLIKQSSNLLLNDSEKLDDEKDLSKKTKEQLCKSQMKTNLPSVKQMGVHRHLPQVLTSIPKRSLPLAKPINKKTFSFNQVKHHFGLDQDTIESKPARVVEDSNESYSLVNVLVSANQSLEKHSSVDKDSLPATQLSKHETLMQDNKLNIKDELFNVDDNSMKSKLLEKSEGRKQLTVNSLNASDGAIKAEILLQPWLANEIDFHKSNLPNIKQEPFFTEDDMESNCSNNYLEPRIPLKLVTIKKEVFTPDSSRSIRSLNNTNYSLKQEIDPISKNDLISKAKLSHRKRNFEKSTCTKRQQNVPTINLKTVNSLHPETKLSSTMGVKIKTKLSIEDSNSISRDKIKHKCKEEKDLLQDKSCRLKDYASILQKPIKQKRLEKVNNKCKVGNSKFNVVNDTDLGQKKLKRHFETEHIIEEKDECVKTDHLKISKNCENFLKDKEKHTREVCRNEANVDSRGTAPEPALRSHLNHKQLFKSKKRIALSSHSISQNKEKMKETKECSTKTTKEIKRLNEEACHDQISVKNYSAQPKVKETAKKTIPTTIKGEKEIKSDSRNEKERRWDCLFNSSTPKLKSEQNKLSFESEKCSTFPSIEEFSLDSSQRRKALSTLHSVADEIISSAKRVKSEFQDQLIEFEKVKKSPNTSSNSKEYKGSKKFDLKEEIASEVKLVLKPFYSLGVINKEDYKDIMRRAVPKIFLNCGNTVNPDKIKRLVLNYVSNLKPS